MYHHEFQNQSLQLLLALEARIRVWTVVHGQLITSATSRISDHMADIDTVAVERSRGPTAEPVLSPAATEDKLTCQKCETVPKVGPSRRHSRTEQRPCLSGRQKLSVSESNLVAGRRRFDRKCETRQSAPHAGYLNQAMSTDSVEEEVQPTV